MPNKTNWRERFDNAFDLDAYGESHIVQNKVKSFIESLLEAQREEILEKVNSLKEYRHLDFPDPLIRKFDLFALLLQTKEK